MPYPEKNYLAGALLAAVAVLVGFGIAQEDWLWPGLVTAAALGVITFRLSPWSVPSSALLFLLTGFILGNRGFAQLSPLSSLPLFPGEVGLAAALAVMAWLRARRQPVDLGLAGIGGVILAWIVYGACRLVPDLPRHGLLAVRDFAMVYYAAFFFVGRFAGSEAGLPRLFETCLRVSTALLLPLYAVFVMFPDFFISTLTLRGVPLIYYKDDLAGTFFAVGAVAWYYRSEVGPQRGWPLVIALTQAAAVVATHNRASLLALGSVVGFLALRGHLKLLRVFVLSTIAAGIALTLWVETGGARWEDTPVPGLLYRVASIVDLEGRANNAEESKGDNNRFRAVWWQNVAADTVAENPWLGLGFGADLSAHFLQVYYPDSTEEFTARSPHCFPLTLFARIGWLGLGLFLIVPAYLVRELWIRLGEPEPFAHTLPLCAALAVFVSACLGVVMEGPMGAVLFWSALGLASATRSQSATNSQRSLDNPGKQA